MKNGRSGQVQHGVDVSGQPNEADSWAGVQCKGKDNYAEKELTENELIAEIEKAKNFVPPLRQWILATSGPKDAAIEELARRITRKNRKNGLFSVSVWGWKDILERLEEVPEVIEKHYPFLSGNTTATNKKLDEIKEATQEILETKSLINSSISNLTDEVKSLKLEKYESGSRPSEDASSFVLTEYQAELDHSRDLLNSFKYRVCIDYLEKLKFRIWSSAPPIIRFRILTNLGAAKLQQGENVEAARLFLEAYQYNPEEEKAITNVALAHLLLEQPEDAEIYAKRALQKNPANASAYSIYIQTHLPDNSLETALSKVPQSHRSLPEVAYILALTAHKNGKLKEMEVWLDTALQNDEVNSPDIRGTMGGLLLDSVVRQQGIITADQLNKTQKDELVRCRKLLTEAWDRVAETDLKQRGLVWLLNRSLANKLLGDLESATRDVEIALTIQPTNSEFLRHRAVLAYLSGDSEYAITILRDQQHGNGKFQAGLTLADILLTNDKAAEATEILSGLLSDVDVPDHRKEDIKRSLIDAYIKLKDFSSAKAVSDEMRSLDPTAILNLIDASRIARATGKPDEALAYLNEARKFLVETTSYKDLAVIANEFYALEQFEEAANIYERIANTDEDSYLTHRLLNSYYRFGRLTPALEICLKLRVKNGPLPFITHIESAIYEEIDDLAQAKEVCHAYLRTFPDDSEMKLRLAVVSWRDGKVDELDEYLNSSPNYNDFQLKTGLQLAHLYAIRGRIHECFDIIYELRRKYYYQPESHLEYVRLFLESAKDLDEWLSPRKVRADVAVRIEDLAGEREWFVIENRRDADFRQREVNLEHSLVQHLMDKAVGDEVVLKEGLHSPEMGKIVEIKSKYVHALHETISVFEKMFPGTDGLWAVHVGTPSESSEIPKGFKSILDSISARQDRGHEIERYYKQGNLTIGSFASLGSTGPIEVWNSLRANADVGIRSSLGSIEESNMALTLLSTGKPKLVIDLIALLTVYSLSVGDVLVNMFGRFLISQTTLEALQDFIREKRGIGASGFMSLWKEGDKFVRSETTAEDVKHTVEYFEGMHKWTSENCDVVPIKRALDVPRERKDILSETLGKAFVDTLLIAMENDNLLFSDDERLRSFAKSEFNVDGVWTQIVLQFVMKNKGLSKTEYTEAILSLVCSHYYHTSIDADVLIEGANKSDWLPAYPYTEVLKSLHGGRSDDESTLKVTVLFMYELWKQPILPSRRDYLVYSLLDALAVGRNPGKTADKLAMMVRSRFLLVPLESQRLTNLIDLWKGMHLQ